MKRLLASAAVLLALAVPAGASTPLTVFAASSLTGAFQNLDPGQRYSFAGSDTLAAQIAQGAPADVFASASPKYTQELYLRHLVEKPVAFATNRLVLIVPRSNPAHITSVYDLARKRIKLVMAAASVPVGAYTRKALARLGLSRLVARAVSQEPDVKSVVGKVALGQADAGFVYVTDARSGTKDIRAFELPARAQPRISYEIAVVAASHRLAAARAFVKRVLGKSGQAALAREGFGRP